MFRSIDRDNSGTVSTRELKQAFARYGYNFSDAEIARFVATVDVNNDGQLNLQGNIL